MLLEHATLGSIRSLMTYRQRPIPVPVVLHIVKTLILGLDTMHRSGYVHLDIKPANLFVHGDGRLVLGDLGLAAPIGSTRPGVAGSPRFMSRRQLMSDIKLTADLDWYAGRRRHGRVSRRWVHHVCRYHEGRPRVVSRQRGQHGHVAACAQPVPLPQDPHANGRRSSASRSAS
ncbi:kinase-like domain-containing protein [Catenaria anguillulae PL171]|uniref:Kinase-like domain-containing protein n=1 Tax=Catenaria anguillulae PL171 TaxID=765915 RepID=A0A1Y2HUW6_9FUNG|nr:kinase-like domain-containing protein [Catenaria anguillulae PL171]